MNVRNVRIPRRLARHPRLALSTLAACAVLVIGGPVAVAQAAANSAAAAGNTVHFSGLSQVGALFSSADYTGSTASHFCTGTVIDSPRGDLVLTAAHCVASFATSTYTAGTLTFAPGYDNGLDSHLGGAWSVEQVDLAPGYAADQNPEDDYALLVIAPRNGLDIQQVTGGLKLGTTQLPEQVSVVGYNDLVYDVDGNEPIICRTTAYEETDDSEPWARFNCPNYQDGTSGGPWITRNGTVIGVIGGYEQGGNTPSVSYSARFGQAVRDLYNTAVRKN